MESLCDLERTFGGRSEHKLDWGKSGTNEVVASDVGHFK